MPKQKRNLTLDEDAAAVLDRVGNASAYVSRMVKQRYDLVQSSLAILRSCGVRRQTIHTACLALHSVQWITDTQMMAILEDAGMKKLAEASARAQSVTIALRALAQEYHSGNEAFRKELEQ